MTDDFKHIHLLSIIEIPSTEQPPFQQMTPVGFSAYSTTLASYNAGDVIQFPYIITNVGNHYNSVTDTFVAPYPGFYMFSASISSDDNQHVRANIMQEGSLLATAYADDLATTVHTTHHQASMVVVTECAAGDRVWIESEDIGQIYSDSSRISVFTGVMLVQYSNDTIFGTASYA